MPAERSARYEYVIVGLLALFWGTVGLNRFGIGMIFPVIVPEFQLAGWQAGLYPGPEEFARSWHLERSFRPMMAAEERESRYRGWQEALARTLSRG